MLSAHRTKRFRYSLTGAALGILLVLAVMPYGTAAAQNSCAFISDLGREATALLGANVPPALRLTRFRRLFDENFDVRSLARFALGRYWLMATPRARREYFVLFAEYTSRLWSTRLADIGEARFEVTGCFREDGESIVRSVVYPANSNPIRVDWHVRNYEGRYRITDVDIDGMSLKLAERKQFANWIEINGGQFDALLAVLRQQLGEG